MLRVNEEESIDMVDARAKFWSTISDEQLPEGVKESILSRNTFRDSIDENQRQKIDKFKTLEPEPADDGKSDSAQL